MTSPVRIGILGAGSISDTHARAAQSIPGVEVAAVYGQNVDKARALAERCGATAYDSLERFLDHRPMDIVAIGSPSSLHAAEGAAAASRGLHVLVEKPLDITDGPRRRPDRRRRSRGRQARRLLPGPAEARCRADEGARRRRRPRHARCSPRGGSSGFARRSTTVTRAGAGPLRYDGGGALINQAIHTVDLLLHLAGPIASVEATTATRLHRIEVEDTVVATLQFASGAIGVFEASTAVYPGYPRRLELTGSHGTMILDHDSLVAVDLTPEGQAAAGDVVAPAAHAASAQNAASATVSDATPHRRIIEDFIAAIRTGGEPICSGREGRRSIAVVEAIYASARGGRRATIESR